MRLKKFIPAAALTAAVAVSLTGCKGVPDTIEKNPSSDTAVSFDGSAPVKWLPDVDIHNFNMPEEGEKIAVINVKDHGTIKIKLFPEDAEKGVENFTGLAEMGYYDELIFHRVIPHFMNQGGDPRGNGTGGNSIWGGTFEGGTSEHLFHFAGAVAYANSQGTSTNGSQFYIVNTPAGEQYSSTCEEIYAQSGGTKNWPANAAEKYKEVGGTPMLDGSYTVFGQVFEGMDVVRAISEVETNQGEYDDMPVDKPLTPVVMESVKIEEYKG